MQQVFIRFFNKWEGFTSISPFAARHVFIVISIFQPISLKQKELVEALLREIKLRKEEIQSLKNLRTLYFGGGTPSVLNKTEILSLMQEIQNLLPFSSHIEFTLEANPDDLSLTYLEELKEVGINRLSIGTQSFSEEVLNWMNRSHNAQQSISAIKNVRKVGFDNFSCDLIFGNPHSEKDSWEEDVEQLLSLKVPHISVYSLTVEEKDCTGSSAITGKNKNSS